jgi:hypothetical protein
VNGFDGHGWLDLVQPRQPKRVHHKLDCHGRHGLPDQVIPGDTPDGRGQSLARCVLVTGI